MTTVSPTFIRGLAERVNRAGADFLDAPVSGSVSAAEGGTLVPFVGGDEAVLERVRPIFALFSQKIVHMGANGQGVAMKVAINVNLGAQLVSLAECVLLADRAGIPREKALEALLNSVAASPFLKYKGPAALNLPKEVWFSLTMYQKDLRLALDYGRELGVPLFNTSVCNDLATIGRANGMSDQDFAALFSVVEMLAGAKSG